MLACHPVSAVVVTTVAGVESGIGGTVVVQLTVQRVRKITALRRNGCGLVALTKKQHNNLNRFKQKRSKYVLTDQEVLYDYNTKH